MRRANRGRIYQAKLAGLRGRIVRQWRQTEEQTAQLLRGWETETSTRGLVRREPGYWDEAARWIAERLARS